MSGEVEGFLKSRVGIDIRRGREGDGGETGVLGGEKMGRLQKFSFIFVKEFVLLWQLI